MFLVEFGGHAPDTTTRSTKPGMPTKACYIWRTIPILTGWLREEIQAAIYSSTAAHTFHSSISPRRSQIYVGIQQTRPKCSIQAEMSSDYGLRARTQRL